MVYTLNAHAGDYAFILAVEQHLCDYRTELRTRILEKNEPEETLMRLEEVVFLVTAVILFLINKTKRSVMMEDVKQSNSLAESFTYNFDKILSKPKLCSFDMTPTTPTDELVNDVLDTERPRSIDIKVERESDLAATFGSILKRAVNIYHDALSTISPSNEAANLSEFDRLSLYSSLFIKKLQMLPENSGFDSHKVEIVRASLENCHNTEYLQLDKVQDVFIQLLRSHLEFVGAEGKKNREISIINKLREQGNNLMSNQCYAQAIKIYTNAIDIATFPDGTNKSQLLTNRAIAFIGLNCFPEAIEDLNQAVQLDRTFTPAWTQLGYCHLYMGKSLVSLKCYLAALKAASGEILPEGLFNELGQTLYEYRFLKVKTILPQFIQRLSQSIALTERRAYQQREDETQITKVIAEVKSILVSLQEKSKYTYDASYYDYKSTYSNPPFRSLAERANRARPNILTQDVAQNMLATSGVEAEVSAPRNPLESFGFGTTVSATPPAGGANINRSNNDEGNERVSTATATTANGVRELLNDFGDLFEGRFDIQETPSFGRQRNQEQDGERTDNTMRDVFRGILPRQLGNIIGRSFNNVTGHQGSPPGNTDRSNATSRTDTSTNSSGRTNSNSNSNSNSSNNDTEDVDMPQVPDLD